MKIKITSNINGRIGMFCVIAIVAACQSTKQNVNAQLTKLVEAYNERCAPFEITYEVEEGPNGPYK
ncbi:hypothetical protein [Candidatus Cardinium hertigii]|jgi:hypothetical protein|uniref:Uncharacterized protein n=1 Tax=Candidatus Cardinium hertigii TaxID=247481 RepID=A0A3N2QBB1_9BACT|nr:hypothetical protein [Candidatus Cardinium hertigii]ROT47060.1 hypothetical protein EDM02_04170 [Candidatus Cardinium hertigii]